MGGNAGSGKSSDSFLPFLLFDRTGFPGPHSWFFTGEMGETGAGGWKARDHESRATGSAEETTSCFSRFSCLTARGFPGPRWWFLTREMGETGTGGWRDLRTLSRDPIAGSITFIAKLSSCGGFHVGQEVALCQCMPEDTSLHEDLTEQIIGCAMTVHDTLGPGLLESIYERCLVLELRASSLRVETERYVPVVYRGIVVDSPFRLDLVVEDLVVVEVKAVQVFAQVHHAQVISYLKLTGYPVGLLINFNVTLLKHGIRKVVRPDLYKKRPPVSPVFSLWEGVIERSLCPCPFTQARGHRPHSRPQP